MFRPLTSIYVLHWHSSRCAIRVSQGSWSSFLIRNMGAIPSALQARVCEFTRS
ncbi:hypothetical protein AIOL_003122 [Candidatus Rhodobacter oscarellae]|uniref:Uncharacterized protein n=1 Tax=Candidatus Rhodobacter oscarellae TaxID=1675527 RepID=A0A0J9E670_9RHOB|nr:hypothetical protein AIOL_003122 [Candidatus Rhodobacter lobularis]